MDRQTKGLTKADQAANIRYVLERDARRRLIAAGPALLAALKALVWQHDNNDGKLCGMALQDARAAIQLAENNT